MPRRKPDREVPTDSIEAAEWAIREVMKNPKTTPTQLMQAVAATVKLQFLKHKITEPENDAPGSFFKQRAAE